MKDPYDMDEAEFLAALEEKTNPMEIFHNAKRIYEYLTELFESDCNDSVMREWAFGWYASRFGQTQKDKASAYEAIYEEWLEG